MVQLYGHDLYGIQERYEKGKKECEILYPRNDIYNIGPARIKFEIHLKDEAGNSTTQTIYSEPTIPYEPMLTEGVEKNQTLDNLKGSQLAGTKGSKAAYLMSIAGNGKAIYYSGPSAVDSSGECVEKSEYRINGWVADSNTNLEGFYQYNVTLDLPWGQALTGRCQQ